MYAKHIDYPYRQFDEIVAADVKPIYIDWPCVFL